MRIDDGCVTVALGEELLVPKFNAILSRFCGTLPIVNLNVMNVFNLLIDKSSYISKI